MLVIWKERAKPRRARSFQITSIYSDFTVLENVMLAVQAHSGSGLRFWRPAREEASLRSPASAILEVVGLRERAGVLAANLAHAEQRSRQIATTPATRARLLRLDAPD